MEAFVGRQTIYDRNLRTFAYELLFRDGPENAATIGCERRATSEVMLAAFLDIGMDRVTGSLPAFINLSRDFLITAGAPPLPPERIVIEILEDTEVDETLVDAVEGLSSDGYRFALDDFVYAPKWRPLLEIASIIKIDVLALTPEEVAEHVERLAPFGAQLLAEKVETQSQFDDLHRLGFDLFQGFFLSRPRVLSSRRLADNHAATLHLLARMCDPEVEVCEIEELVRRDVGLSFRLMRYINSASMALPKRVDSIRKAVVYVGLETLKRWVSLAAIARIDDCPHDLVNTALVRGKFCEGLCAMSGRADPDRGFTAGLFSALEPILQVSVNHLLPELRLAEELEAALLTRQGPLGEILSCVLAYEGCEWEHVAVSGMDSRGIRFAYIESLEWASQLG